VRWWDGARGRCDLAENFLATGPWENCFRHYAKDCQIIILAWLNTRSRCGGIGFEWRQR
jgi:hypothetical protein